MALRRASTDDIPAIVALTEAAYLPNESIIGVPSLPRLADYTKVLAEHEVWLAETGEEIDGVPPGMSGDGWGGGFEGGTH